MDDFEPPAPDEKYRAVVDAQTFSVFLEHLSKEAALAENVIERDPEGSQWTAPMGWENLQVSRFLDVLNLALTTGRQDSDLTWKVLARALCMAKVYE